MLKNILKFLGAGIITLILPVLIWNVWFLDYIDKSGKLIPFLMAPIFAFVGTIIITGFEDIAKPLKGLGPDGQEYNPFYGWGFFALLINIIIVILSNT